MAASAPAASVGLTIAALAAATAYGSGPIIILTAIPMLIIANAYRRLNMWNANCGASFEWVGKAINPYLGFLTGWLMVAAYVLGTLSGVEVLAPSVLSVFGSNSTATWGNIGIATALALIMVAIAVLGIKLTARTQVGMAAVEYLILLGFAVAGLVFVLSHHHGTYAITSGWASPTGVGGHGNATAGFLIAVFMFTGWDGAIYVNEETQRRRINPGRAVLIAVALLTVVYFVATVGLQGVVSPAALQANAANAPVYIAQVMGGAGWAKVMALSITLSAIASTGRHRGHGADRDGHGEPPGAAAGARHRQPPVVDPGRSQRRRRPARHRPYLDLPARDVGAERVRRRGGHHRAAVLALLHPHRAGHHGLLPAPAAGPPEGRRAAGGAPAGGGRVPGLDHHQVADQGAPSQRWSMLGIVLAGLVLMFVARFVLRSPFFQIRRETGGLEDAAEA